ncbi:hypothetical protein LMG28688_03549 [Paraburkholderia caffeinitolerans]|uniref:DUF302 domain-containing protein n=1 Tax=Paraburkholderia caffeinitolerans TaxID=1723730 RepID=A0A6J5G6D9_9BURK|nr:DUF302 domain-containing protein [Paraburkholderia caffeinitolerans]CAB3792594.1 hypothetical protein LMG28688_03549 [Paraburkholderia caffeinitolerans]
MTEHPQHPPSVLTYTSTHDFDTTIARLKAVLERAGAVVFADVDQRDAAALAGLELRRTRLLMFGNPKAGTPVMAANPHAALELPLRLVVWEDEEGRVQVDYRDVAQTLGPLYGIAPDLLVPLQRVAELLRATVQ